MVLKDRRTIVTDQTVDITNASIASRGDYGDVLKTIIAEGNCPFCREHFLQHHRKPILRETDFWILTTNSWGYKGTQFHFMLIAKKHVERIQDLPTIDRIEFFQEYDWLAEAFGFTGATILFRSGNTKITGASVNHLHAHVIVGMERNDESESITGLVGFREKE